MDYDWTEVHDAYRARLRDFLDQELPADWPRLSENFDVGSEDSVAFARAFCPKLAEAGFLVPHWPEAYGGAGLDAWHHWILNEEMFAAGEPRSYQYMSVNWAGPAIIAFGSDEQKSHHLPRIAQGTMFYCQGFSEPNAGSDLASLRTSAERTATGYRVNGQKIWTSAASFADYCILMARTGADKRKGISAFLVPMDRPGITVRIIRGYQGGRALHEVFFDNVEIAETDRLGGEGEGWSIIAAVMHNERVGAPRYTLSLRGLEAAVALLKSKGRFTDTGVRARAARVRAALRAAQLQCFSVIDRRVKGLPPTAETNTARYAMVYGDRLLADFLTNELAEELVTNEDPVVSAAYRRTASTGIASGTAEVQLNLIARNLLSLPRSA